MKHVSLIISFVFSFHLSFGDSVGHLFESHETTFIKLMDQRDEQLPIDSICILIPGSDRIIQRHPMRTEGWRTSVISLKDDGYLVSNLGPNFMVLIFSKSTKYYTNVIKNSGGDLYIFKIKNGRLADVSPFFHDYWYKYIVSLLVTLLIESLIGLTFLTTQRKSTFLFTFILLNIATHFAAWFLYSRGVPVFFLELVIIFVESLYWDFVLKSTYGQAVKVSLILNLASWIIGAAITTIM